MAALDIRVLGLGNVLMGDDGFGPFVIESFTAAYDVPANVSVVDLGTPGLDLTPYLAGADAVIVVDTIRADGPPGTIRLYRRGDLFKHGPPLRMGPHDPGFAQTLLTLEFADCAPKQVLLVGAIPQLTAPCAKLTGTLRGAVAEAIDAIALELGRLGVSVTPREHPPDVVPWWERNNPHPAEIPA